MDLRQSLLFMRHVLKLERHLNFLNVNDIIFDGKETTRLIGDLFIQNEFVGELENSDYSYFSSDKGFYMIDYIPLELAHKLYIRIDEMEYAHKYRSRYVSFEIYNWKELSNFINNITTIYKDKYDEFKSRYQEFIARYI